MGKSDVKEAFLLSQLWHMVQFIYFNLGIQS